MGLNRNQLAACGPSEFRVEAEHVDRELHLVDDTLARRLAFTPQFKIGERIVCALTVLMMHCFMLLQRAAHFFFHHSALFKFFAATSNVKANVARRVHMTFEVDRAPTATFVATFFGAKALPLVVACVLAILGSTQSPISGFAAELALESRHGAFVHLEQLPQADALVKEIA